MAWRVFEDVLSTLGILIVYTVGLFVLLVLLWRVLESWRECYDLRYNWRSRGITLSQAHPDDPPQPGGLRRTILDLLGVSTDGGLRCALLYLFGIIVDLFSWAGLLGPHFEYCPKCGAKGLYLVPGPAFRDGTTLPPTKRVSIATG